MKDDKWQVYYPEYNESGKIDDWIEADNPENTQYDIGLAVEWAEQHLAHEAD